MHSPIGVPHREIAVVGSRLSCGRGLHRKTIGKLRIVTTYITHLTRQEGGAIKGAIELVDTSRILILHINRMQTGYPFRCQTLHHTLKVVSLSLSSKIVHCTLFGSKRSGRLEDDRFMGLSFEREPGTETITASILYLVISL